MSRLQKLRFAAFASVCMLPLIAAAQAQDNGGFDLSDTPPPQAETTSWSTPDTSLGEVTIGIGGQTQTSSDFGRYNGMPQSGVGVVGSWNLHQRDPWDGTGTHYFSFTGNDINFGFGKMGPEASLNLKIGDQGVWGVSASYDAMTYTASDHFTTILDGNGNLSPGYQNALIGANMYFNNVTTLPSSLFGSFNGTTHLATSNPKTAFGEANELTLDIGTRRDKGTIEGSYYVGAWLVTSSISHEHKEGSLEQAMTTGGNNAGMVTFPMPINYDTDAYMVAAAYNTDKLQAKLSYEFSNFTDNNSGGYAFQGWNFSAYRDPGTSQYTSYPKSGVYSLPPSNQAHTVTGEVGYTFDPTTRLYATAVYGLQLQNDPFVPATLNAYYSSAPGAALAAQLASNPTSLRGMVQTFFGSVVFTARPLPELNIKASYTVDARSPQTNSMWIYGNPTDNTSLKYRQAVPESWTKQTIVLTAGYDILQDTRITVGYTFRDALRSNAITRSAQDNEASVKVHSVLSSNVMGSLSYVHAERTASAPDWSLWLVQIPSDCGSTLAALGCQQVPFYQAARTQDSITGNLTAMLDQKTSLNLFGKYNVDEYHNPAAVYKATINPSVGINRDYSIQGGPDLNYQIDAGTELHAYYTFQRSFRDMRALNEQSVVGGSNFYEVASTYDIHTVGLGGTMQVNEKMKLVGDYTFSYGGQAFAQSGDWNLGVPGDPMLNTKSANNQVKLRAVYEYSPSTSYYLGYKFDSVDTNDWALVGASVGQVLTGDIPPKYNVSTITVAMTMKL